MATQRSKPTARRKISDKVFIRFAHGKNAPEGSNSFISFLFVVGSRC